MRVRSRPFIDAGGATPAMRRIVGAISARLTAASIRAAWNPIDRGAAITSGTRSVDS